MYPPVEFPTRMLPKVGMVERPVPPYATESVDDPMMVPPALVVRSADGIWKSVVDPVFEILKSVEVAPVLVVEEMVKSVLLREVDAAWRESVAYGEVVPRPRLPVCDMKVSEEVPLFPKRMVFDALSPWLKAMVVLVAFTVEPKLVAVVQS